MALFIALSITFACLGFQFSGLRHHSLFDLSNLVGPTVKSFVDRGVMEAMPGYYGARMPLATLFVATVFNIFGDSVDIAMIVKIALTFVVLYASVWITFSGAEWGSERTLVPGAVLVLLGGASFTIANVVNLQVEEAYGFAPMALCWAMLLNRRASSEEAESWLRGGPAWRGLLFGISLALIFLAKSSYLGVVVVLLLIFGLLNGFITRQFLLSTIVLLAVALSWGAYQKHNSGRFSLGTSLDGWNLYKGNNPHFNLRYPPEPGTSLDQYDVSLFKDGPKGSEWEISDYYVKESLRYAQGNPKAWARGLLKKLHVAFFSLEKSGSTKSTGYRYYYEFLSLGLMRAVLWCSIAISVMKIFRGSREEAIVGGGYLGFICLLLLPYLVGFLYTRHLSVLGIPAGMVILSLWVPRCSGDAGVFKGEAPRGCAGRA